MIRSATKMAEMLEEDHGETLIWKCRAETVFNTLDKP